MMLAAAVLAVSTGCGSTEADAGPSADTAPAAVASETPSPTLEPTATVSETTEATATPTPSPTSAPVPTSVEIGGTLHIMGPDLYETVPGTKVEPHSGEEWSQECYGIGTADGLAAGTRVRITDTGGERVASGEIVATHGGPKGSTRLGQECLLEWSAKVRAGQRGVLRAVFGDTDATTNEFTLKEAIAGGHALDLFIGNQ